MNIFKKTICLRNKEKNSKSMAILTLEKNNQKIFCTLKLYNFIQNDECILGIKLGNTICKQNIPASASNYNFILNQSHNLNDKIGCVLLKPTKNDFIPILWGSEKYENYKTQIINNLNKNIQKLHSIENKKTIDFTEVQLQNNTNENYLHN